MKLKFSPLEKVVFKVVCQIPLGQTRSYQWVAKRIGKPRAIRAVGQVLKKNKFPLFIPCHRVIKADGNIGGYSKGKKYKRLLLKIEKEIAALLREAK